VERGRGERIDADPAEQLATSVWPWIMRKSWLKSLRQVGVDDLDGRAGREALVAERGATLHRGAVVGAAEIGAAERRPRSLRRRSMAARSGSRRVDDVARATVAFE
jgi:hypothetical protein